MGAEPRSNPPSAANFLGDQDEAGPITFRNPATSRPALQTFRSGKRKRNRGEGLIQFWTQIATALPTAFGAGVTTLTG